MEQVDLLSELSLHRLELFKYRTSVPRYDQAAPATPENDFFASPYHAGKCEFSIGEMH